VETNGEFSACSFRRECPFVLLIKLIRLWRDTWKLTERKFQGRAVERHVETNREEGSG